MQTTLTTAALVLVLALAAAAQEENVKRVDRLGEQAKILTPGQIDAWVFEGKAGETVVARVASEAFDPVLELVDDKEAKLRDVDDPGSQSRFAAELPRDATYRVRVRAFKDSGGGRYGLLLDRFTAAGLALGAPATGTLGVDGRGHHRIDAQAGDLLAVKLASATVSHHELLDTKGQALHSARVEKTGVHYVRVAGPPGASYGITVRRAVVRDLPAGAEQKGEVSDERMEAWTFAGEPAQVALIEVLGAGPLIAEVVYAPEKDPEEGVIREAAALDDLRILARHAKGGRTRLACLLGRAGRYQVLVRGTSSLVATHAIRRVIGHREIAAGGEHKGELAVGEFALYTLRLRAGEVVTIDAATERFDSALQLFSARGDLVQSNDDRGLDVSSRMTVLNREDATCVLVVASLANAGSGPYTLAVRAQGVKELRRGARNDGSLDAGGVEIWQVRAAKDEVVILSASSRAFDTVLQVFDARGVERARDDNGGAGTNSLLALRAPEDGVLTVWVSSRNGHGSYGLRALEE